ncbi:MAG: hypothetical protein QY309_11325 [Cyclobacteriaceae bacterium]|jgi:hypothetical protein|nr:MAG: hypothetical protein QY309_11325 [Cyclobacteriaceae bacterium]
MKKLLYSLALALFVSVGLSACSDEEIKPTTELDNGAAGVQGDQGKN